MQADQNSKIPEGFLKNIENTSLVRFSKHSMRDDVFLSAQPEHIPTVIGHWMGLIMLASPSCRFIFKVHYNSDEMLAVTKEALSLDGVTYSARIAQISDYMKEYCNLFGGALKLTLEEKGIATGLSLPLVTRGFDQLFYAQTRPGLIIHSWTLNCAGTKILAQIEIEILNPAVLKDLETITAEQDVEKNDGSLEFF